MNLKMTKAEREDFLAGVHVAIVSIEEPGRGPLTAPVWYSYEPGGDILFLTGKDSRKGRLLEHASRMTLCVQQEQLPYKYVTVEGPFTTEKPDYELHRKPLAYRYLGPQAGEGYLAANGGAGEVDGELLVRLKPERWLTADYSKMGRR